MSAQHASPSLDGQLRSASIKAPTAMRKDLMQSQKRKQEEFEARNLHWVKLVIEFFELHYMAIIERRKALRIERFFCNVRRQRIRATFNAYIYKIQGISMRFDKVPRGISLMILSYLTKLESMSLVAGLSRRYRSLARDPALWRSMTI